jgi:hypothetical protein
MFIFSRNVLCLTLDSSLLIKFGLIFNTEGVKSTWDLLHLDTQSLQEVSLLSLLVSFLITETQYLTKRSVKKEGQELTHSCSI